LASVTFTGKTTSALVAVIFVCALAADGGGGDEDLPAKTEQMEKRSNRKIGKACCDPNWCAAWRGLIE
jgi:hypothetical protein